MEEIKKETGVENTDNAVSNEENINKDKDKNTTPSNFIGFDKKKLPEKPSHFGDIKELMEKNLKWSQIIYEQNRRIIRRLTLSAVAAWVKWLLVVAVLIWGAWYGWPIVKKINQQYESIVGQFQTSTSDKKDETTALQKILNLLNLNQQQEEQLKAMNN
jgi:hypothetical protein